MATQGHMIFDDDKEFYLKLITKQNNNFYQNRTESVYVLFSGDR